MSRPKEQGVYPSPCDLRAAATRNLPPLTYARLERASIAAAEARADLAEALGVSWSLLTNVTLAESHDPAADERDPRTRLGGSSNRQRTEDMNG